MMSDISEYQAARYLCNLKEKKCIICNIKETPQWRSCVAQRLETNKIVKIRCCNACGLKVRKHVKYGGYSFISNCR